MTDYNPLPVSVLAARAPETPVNAAAARINPTDLKDQAAFGDLLAQQRFAGYETGHIGRLAISSNADLGRPAQAASTLHNLLDPSAGLPMAATCGVELPQAVAAAAAHDELLITDATAKFDPLLSVQSVTHPDSTVLPERPIGWDAGLLQNSAAVSAPADIGVAYPEWDTSDSVATTTLPTSLDTSSVIFTNSGVSAPPTTLFTAQSEPLQVSTPTAPSVADHRLRSLLPSACQPLAAPATQDMLSSQDGYAPAVVSRAEQMFMLAGSGSGSGRGEPGQVEPMIAAQNQGQVLATATSHGGSNTNNNGNRQATESFYFGLGLVAQDGVGQTKATLFNNAMLSLTEAGTGMNSVPTQTGLPLADAVFDKTENLVDTQEFEIPQPASSVLQTRLDSTALSGKGSFHLQERMGQPGWNQELGQRVQVMLQQNLQQAQIQLNPRHLGPIDIQISMGLDQQVSVSFNVQQPAVKEALESALPLLREMLQEQGMKLVNADVSHQSKQERGSASDYQREETRESWRAASEGEETQPSLSVTGGGGLELRSGVDLFA